MRPPPIALPWREILRRGGRGRGGDFQPMRQVDIVAAEAALGQDDRDVGCKLCRALTRAVDHHAREPRRQRKRPQRPALLGDAAIGIDGAKVAQQSARLRDARRRWRVEKRQGRRIAHAPLRQIEHEAGEVCGENFRPVGGFERCRLRLLPEPVADAGLGAAGATTTLVGRRARDAHGL